MKNLFKIFTFVFVLSFIVGMNLSAQDQPTSIGPAPMNNSIDNAPFVQQPVTFPDLLRGLAYGGKHIPAPINLVSFPVPAGTPFTPVGAPYTTLLQGGDFGAGGIFYATRSPSTLITINTTTGVQTVVTSITGTSGTITAMGYHPGSSTMYLGTTNITSSRLYTLNTTTGAATLVGIITGCKGLIAMGVNCAGEIYGVDIVGDNAYKINPTTGAGTLLGPLGFNANYAQDADFEFSTNTMYLAAYPGSWRTMNLTTGMTTLITSWPSTEVTALGIVGDCPGPPTCNYIAGSWCPAGTLPNLPGASIYGCAVWLGDTLYMQAPNNGSASTTVRKYTWGGTWSLGTPLPSSKRYGAMTECNGKLYFIGGGTGSAGGNTNYEYDPGTGAWTTKANLPASLSGHGAVSWGDSVIFVVGGPWTTNGSHRNVYYYRVGSNTWGTITNSLPSGQGRRSHGTGIYENKIVICAGYKYASPNFMKSTWIGLIGSNATQLTWTAAPDVPVPFTGLSRMGGTYWDKYFFTVGGERGGVGGNHNVSYVLDISTATWIDSIKPMPHAYSNISNQVAAKCLDDTTRVFVPGGYSSGYKSFFDVTGCGPVITHFKITSTTPKTYNLSQNYPNPFNPTTKISYTIPKTGLVTLQVYDILGKEIATLVNEVKNTGSYIVEFNGSKLSSGIYFYRLQSEDFVAVKKMMFIK